MLDILTAIGIETINNKKGSAENDESNNHFSCYLFLANIYYCFLFDFCRPL